MRPRRFADRKSSDYSEAFERQKQLTSKQRNNEQRNEDFSKSHEIICNFFLNSVKKESPDWLIQQFDNLFISQLRIVDLNTNQALYLIIALNQEQVFRDTLKRCCYILINNWSGARYHQHIQKLIKIISQVSEGRSPLSPTKRRLREWLKRFISSGDYQELSLFVAKYNNREKERWSNRYASYLLTSQFLDSTKPREQREAAIVVADQLKEQFKFDLAMYTARSPLTLASLGKYYNPTDLGDDLLELIQKILTKRKTFSYASVANIFLQQVKGLLYKRFKASFLKYLLFSLEDVESLDVLEIYLSEYIEPLYKKHNEDEWNPDLLLRTCNRLIEHLTTQTHGRPSQLFTWLALQGKYFTLAILLLKIILISKNSYLHLEACIGYLIQYYSNQSEAECQWFIRFLEILKLVLTIYAENIRYNLVSMNGKLPKKVQRSEDLNSFRIFSQVKPEEEKAYQNI
jgi:hypothetical protein